MPTPYLYLLVSVIAEAIGYSALNASAHFSKFWPSLLVIGGFSLLVIGGFGGAFYFLALTLQYMPLGITYALASGLGIIVVALAGILVFGQRLDLAAVARLTLIIAGIVIIHVLSDFAEHKG